MTADGAIYRSARMAAAYAFSRPPVHRHIVHRASHLLAELQPIDYGLDIGCGAGSSTAVIAPLAKRVVGLEPHVQMLKYTAAVAPSARFVVGQAERLPFANDVFGVITAAGALNYADIEASLADVARVLSPRGLFIPYDFSAGRRLRDDARLDVWYSTFRLRYPSPTGYALNLEALPYDKFGLDVVAYHDVEVVVSMSLPEYVAYLLGEAGIERALSNGHAEADIRRYCEASLQPVFGADFRDVVFEAHIACVRKRVAPG